MADRAPRWERRYSRKLVVSDVLVVLAAVFGAQVVRYGIDYEQLRVNVYQETAFATTYVVLSAVLSLAWITALAIFDTREQPILGSGSIEFRRVINATLATFGTLAILAYTFRSPIGRGYVFIALPTGLFLLLLTRWLWRKRLQRKRKRGLHLHRTLIVGERATSTHVADQILSSNLNGFQIIGAITERGTDRDLREGVPVIGNYDEIISVVDREHVDTLIITSSDVLTPEQIRNVNWALESRPVDLIVAAALTDIAGPRIHTRPVSGLPLIHVELPKFSGPKHFAKRMFDVFASGVLILLLAVPMLIIALLIRMTSKGPVLFLQERVGLGGRHFKMIKFRSMVADAEEQLSDLEEQSEGNGVLFKMRNDPRVTPVGRVLRKFSLDELPQFFNVFGGSMSLVGPRPPLPREVDQYEDWVHRRLLVKPGITGLWQVSGRSNLSWEDSVRLDLYYVENWSLLGDVVILLRTVQTVLRPEGAY